MRTWAVTLGLLVSLAGSGCLGEASALPEELAVYDFTAKVEPAAGNATSNSFQVSLEVVSRSNIDVETDVVLKVTRADGSLVTERHFKQVLFHPEEVWVLAGSFVPGNSDRGPLNFEVIVSRHGTGEELWRSPAPAELLVQ